MEKNSGRWFICNTGHDVAENDYNEVMTLIAAYSVWIFEKKSYKKFLELIIAFFFCWIFELLLLYNIMPVDYSYI